MRKIVVILILFGVLGFFVALKYRDNIRQARQSVKAEEITITIPEGWTNKEIGEYLQERGVVPVVEFLAAAKNFNVSKYSNVFSKSQDPKLQGFLYPDTYRIFASLSDRKKVSALEASNEIIDKLLSNFFQKLPNNADQLAHRQGISLYEAVILASIVEKETGRQTITNEQKNALDQERKIISGIFYNRLKIGMPLESDATVNYVTGKNLPAVEHKDTEINLPYNTYRYKGLPPTPISNPSLSSIVAVLNPIDSDYLFFLHDQVTGKAIYAKTYEEHLKNKEKYLK